ncbi:TetR family transcriptional regulator, partial [Planktotalea sp.]
MQRQSDVRLTQLSIESLNERSLLDKGFHQTGIRDIAARAEVSIGNLYN